MSAREQAVVDALTAALPRLQLAVRSAEQQHQDVAAALDAVAQAVTLLRPPIVHTSERRLASLPAAIVRSGRTFAEVSFLSGIPESRLHNMATGVAPNDVERQSLLRVLPEWKG